jgi:hypothetical protein
MQLKSSQKQSLFDFILSSNVPEWDKKSLVLNELAECEVFVETTSNQISGCLLVKKVSEKNYHCSLVIAKSKSAFKNLAKAFRDKFPSCEVTTALRKGKEIKYSRSIINKVSNI